MEAFRIVVGYDGSTNARRAVEAAIDLASSDATVHVVTAHERLDPHEVTSEMTSLPAEFRSTIDLLAAPTMYLDDASRLLESAGVRHEAHLVEGDPSEAILDLADAVDADLIVVGSRGLHRGSRFLRGSVSTRVSTHARTSFLVVRDNE